MSDAEMIQRAEESREQAEMEGVQVAWDWTPGDDLGWEDFAPVVESRVVLTDDDIPF